MLDNLISLVKQHAGTGIINNPAIPNERNDEAVASASSSIFDSLKNAASGGGLKDILGMFGGQNTAASSQLTQHATNDFADTLASKFGLDVSQAFTVANDVIPGAMSGLVNKTNDTNDSSFNFQDIMGKLSGGGGAIDFGGLLNKFKSGALDKDGDGDVDFQDAMKMLGGSGDGGGIMGKIKGMFGG